MSKGAKSGGSSSSGKGGSLFAGVLLGMVLGLAAAGGVAWYITKKNPSVYENKDHKEAPKAETENKQLAPVASAPASASAPAAASEVSATKQHFEFYKVLTDKPEGAPQKSTEKASAPKETHAATQQTKAAHAEASPKEIYYVQAGSFPNQDDAEKLKAKLALLGLEPSLQTAVIPDRGTYHRVRVGPFNNSSDMNKALATLKQNGVANATSIKVQ